MKKIIPAILIAATLLISLASCGKFTCELCGKEKREDKNEVNFVDKKMIVCAECVEDINELEETPVE